MELRKHLNPRIVFVGLYILAFAAYIMYGLLPAKAAEAYDVVGEIEIPSINLTAEVTDLEMTEAGLKTPDTIAGSYSRAEHKTLLIGHSTTVFADLEKVKIGDRIKYDDREYTVVKLEYAVKNAVDMDEVLAPADKNTIIIMTCAGKLLSNGDATHRFMVTAASE